MSEPTTEAAQVRSFIAHLHRSGEWAYLWKPTGRKDKNGDAAGTSRYFKAGGELPRITSANTYFGVHPVIVRRPEYFRGRTVDVAAVNTLFAEFDVKDYGSKDAIREYLEGKAALWPSFIIDSGGGWHCYFLLDVPFILCNEADREDARALQARFVLGIGGDAGAKDLARVLRLPGTLNAKYDPPRRVEIIEDNRENAIYSLAELREWVSILAPASEPVAACETAPIHIEAKSMRRKDASFIDAFNAASPIDSTLRHYGYTVNGDRFTRPGKNPRDGISGTIKDGRAYTFSSSDLMFEDAGADGKRHAFDSFDVYVKHEHAGDVKKALAELAGEYQPQHKQRQGALSIRQPQHVSQNAFAQILERVRVTHG